MHVKIYTDGSCLGNPGAGGYAAILVYEDGQQEEFFGGSSSKFIPFNFAKSSSEIPLPNVSTFFRRFNRHKTIIAVSAKPCFFVA